MHIYCHYLNRNRFASRKKNQFYGQKNLDLSRLGMRQVNSGGKERKFWRFREKGPGMGSFPWFLVKNHFDRKQNLGENCDKIKQSYRILEFNIKLEKPLCKYSLGGNFLKQKSQDPVEGSAVRTEALEFW